MEVINFLICVCLTINSHAGDICEIVSVASSVRPHCGLTLKGTAVNEVLKVIEGRLYGEMKLRKEIKYLKK
jgi:hypothetical protein